MAKAMIARMDIPGSFADDEKNDFVVPFSYKRLEYTTEEDLLDSNLPQLKPLYMEMRRYELIK